MAPTIAWLVSVFFRVFRVFCGPPWLPSDGTTENTEDTEHTEKKGGINNSRDGMRMSETHSPFFFAAMRYIFTAKPTPSANPGVRFQ